MPTRYRSTVVVFSMTLLGSLGFAVAQDERPVSFEDILALKSVSTPAIAPSGEAVLFALTSWEEDEDGAMDSVSHVHRVDVASGETLQLTFGQGESAPRWSPDARYVSFLASRGKGENVKPQVWLMRTSGGEAFVLTKADEGVVEYAWSADGARLAYTTGEGRSEEQEAQRKRGDDPLVYEDDDRLSSLWIIDVDSRESERLTDGSSFTVKGRPSWSPDGTRIAFTAAPTPWIRDDRDDVYVVGVEDRGLERLTEDPGPDNSPTWSPDGSRIAFISTPNDSEPLPDGTYTRPLVNARLMLYDVDAGRSRDVSTGIDRIPSRPLWTPDSTQLLVTIGDGVHREIFAYDVRENAYRKLTSGGVIDFGGLSRDGSRAAYVLESGAAPSDIYVSEAGFQSARRLTSLHPEVEGLALGESEVIQWKSSDGLDIEGILLKPVGYRPGKRYPLMVVAHGGPTGAHQDNFRVRYGDGGQHWAGKGWAVFYPNPRGSTNYGEAFMRGNLGDWGGGDYRDIMTGVDALIDRGIADPEALAFQGWSYGGYMTCWTVSQTTRFKAAMIGAGLTNLVSMYGTNDIPNYLGTFFEGTLSPETERLYRERSGLTHADNVTTPTLILHGGSDERVPIGQPMEFFRALKDRGVPVELVFYPREGHGLREYYHRLDRMKRQFAWIERHTLGAQASEN